VAVAWPAGDDLGVIASLWPLFGLTAHTSRLELRLPREREIAELASIAGSGVGVHHPGERPFRTAWTAGEPQDRARFVLQEHWSQLGTWSASGWLATGFGWGVMKQPPCRRGRAPRCRRSRFESATISSAGRRERGVVPHLGLGGRRTGAARRSDRQRSGTAQAFRCRTGKVQSTLKRRTIWDCSCLLRGRPVGA